MTRPRTHRVTVAHFYGDQRPSKRPTTMGADGAPVTIRATGQMVWQTHTDTTEHGAKCVFTRERKASGAVEGSREEWLPHDPAKPDRQVLYVFFRYQGAAYTDIVVSELWPRYEGMYA